MLTVLKVERLHFACGIVGDFSGQIVQKYGSHIIQNGLFEFLVGVDVLRIHDVPFDCSPAKVVLQRGKKNSLKIAHMRVVSAPPHFITRFLSEKDRQNKRV